MVAAVDTALGDDWSRPVVGVLGGLGPAATAVFLDLLVRLTDAPTDQDHLDAVVLQHASVPDRTASILDPAAPDPGPVLARDAARLAALGAGLLVLPCNTAHHFAHRIEAASDVPLISIVSETARVAAARTAAPIGIFATEGNIAAGIYQQAIAAAGGEFLVPDADLQADINTLIYDQVKAGRPVDLDLFETCIERMRRQGAEVVVLGCTELSVIYDRHGYTGRDDLVDSLEVLACETITRAGARLRRGGIRER
jgi:aspartate racemase